ncbi:unnamed protein product, partial [marine sediment metagenome]
ILQNAGFKVGDIIEINTTIIVDQVTFSSNLFLKIKSFLTSLPSFFLEENNDLENFFIINPKLLELYFEPLLLSSIDLQVNYKFGCKFSSSFKNTFNIASDLDLFICETNETLYIIYSENYLQPPNMDLSFNPLYERMNILNHELNSDFVFYILCTFPILFLMIIIIYKMKDFSFYYHKKFIQKLEERGFVKKKISHFFFKLFLLIYVFSAIVGILISLTLIFIFKLDSSLIFLQITTFFSIWFLLSFSFQFLFFKSELDKMMFQK